MNKLRSIFFRGLITFLPIAVTIYIIYAGVILVDGLLGNWIRALIPNTYIPGLGFLLTIVIIFVLGLMLNSLVIGGFLHQVEKRLMAIPFIKTVYAPLHDLMNLFTKTGQKDLKSVVLVDLGLNGINSLGLVTRDSFQDLKGLQRQTEGMVTVYVPWSYGIGGLTLLVPKERVTRVDIPTEKALSLALTAWVKSSEDESEKK